MLFVFLFVVFCVNICFGQTAVVNYLPDSSVSYCSYKVRYGKTIADKFEPPCYEPCIRVSGGVPLFKILSMGIYNNEESWLLRDHTSLFNVTSEYKVIE
jgi:hypothetical protein